MKKVGRIFAASLVGFLHAVPAASDQSDPYSVQLAWLINGYRTQHKLPPLALVAPLSELAREHATQMARENRLSHDGFQQRFVRSRSSHCVENVGVNAGSPQVEFDAWRNSRVHDHNLLDPGLTRMGLALEDRYVAFFACR